MITISQVLDAARNRKLTENEVRALRMAFDTQRSRRPATEVSPIRKPRWWKLVALFDGPAKRVMDISGSPVLLQGTVNRDGEDELAVCLVPAGTGPSQGEALRVLLEANLRTPVMVLGSNIHLCRLKQIGEAEAQAIMAAAAAQAKPEEKPALVQTGGDALPPSKVPTAEMTPLSPDEVILPDCPAGQPCDESCSRWAECATGKVEVEHTPLTPLREPDEPVTLPCRECGEEDELVFEHGPDGAKMVCPCGVSGPAHHDLEKARQLWNDLQGWTEDKDEEAMKDQALVNTVVPEE